MKTTSIGICSTGIYEPVQIQYVEDVKILEQLDETRIEKNGVDSLRIASEQETNSYMAICAAKEAIKNAGIDGQDIDLVVYTQSFLPDHLIWPDYAEIQKEIGATKANSLKILQQCNGQMACLDYVYAKMLADKSINYSLIVASEKYPKPLINRWNSNALFWGDGASAAVVKRAEDTNRILATRLATDGTFNRIWQATYKGGVVFPISNENGLMKDEMLADYKRSGLEYQTHGPVRDAIVHSMTEKNMCVLSSILNQLNENLTITKVVTVNRELSWIEKITRQINLNISNTSGYLVREYGHMGACDIFFNLHKMLIDKQIDTGDIVLIFGAGAGYSVGAALIEYM